MRVKKLQTSGYFMALYHVQQSSNLFKKILYSTFSRYYHSRFINTNCSFFKGSQVIVVSYPRSGSSWFAKILSFCPDVTYIREPITQHYVDAGLGNVLKEPQKEFSVFYKGLTKRALNGFPEYKNNIINNIWDFCPWKFGKQRLLIKEVNPRAIPLFSKNPKTQIVLIVRHPAAIAYSYMTMGWFRNIRTGERTKKPNNVQLNRFALEYGQDINGAIQLSEQSKNIKIVKYEDFALEPQKKFKQIIKQLKLRHPHSFKDILKPMIQTGSKTNSNFSITRDSKSQIYKWKTFLTKNQIESIRRGYQEASFKYYGGNNDWVL